MFKIFVRRESAGVQTQWEAFHYIKLAQRISSCAPQTPSPVRRPSLRTGQRFFGMNNPSRPCGPEHRLVGDNNHRRPALTEILGGWMLMIKLTETREITPYLWLHPDEERLTVPSHSKSIFLFRAGTHSALRLAGVFGVSVPVDIFSPHLIFGRPSFLIHRWSNALLAFYS